MPGPGCASVGSSTCAGVSTYPEKRKVVAQLGVSDRITEQTKAAGMRSFTEINAMLAESVASGALRNVPPTFVGAIMGSLAETTMDFMARDPARADDYAMSGFEAFWNAIATMSPCPHLHLTN